MALRVTRQNAEVLAAGDGKVRVTRQNAEVLSAGNGKVRVTRQNIEVLSTVITYEADDSFVFNDETTYQLNRVFITDTFNFTEEIIGTIANKYFPITLESFNFNENTSYVHKPGIHVVNESLIFDEDGDHSIKGRITEETIIFTETVIGAITAFRVHVVDPLFFIEEAICTGSKSFLITENLTDDRPAWTIDGELYYKSYGLGEILNYDLIGPRINEDNTVIFNETIELVHVKSAATTYAVSEVITFIEENHPNSYGLEELITFIETIIVYKCTPTYDILEFTEKIVLETNCTYINSEDLILNEAIIYELYRAGTLCTYSPFVGGSSDPNAPAPPRKTPPSIVKYTNIEFIYPIEIPTHTLILRGPEFGNKDRLKFQRINRESRGGTLTIFADPIWPQTQTMIIEFYALTEAECQNSLIFINTSLGKQIKIRDWEGRLWSGVITNPDNPIVRNGKNNNSITFEIDIEAYLENQEIEEVLTFVEINTNITIFDRLPTDDLILEDEATIATLCWHEFSDSEWDSLAGFEWDTFRGE